MELQADWTIKLVKQDTPESILHLSAVFVVNDDVMYIFSSSPWSSKPVEDMPPTLSELLIFEPFAVLRLTGDSFEECTTSEWQELLNVKEVVSAPTQIIAETMCSADFSIPEEENEDSDSSREGQYVKDDSEDILEGECSDESNISVSDQEPPEQDLE